MRKPRRVGVAVERHPNGGVPQAFRDGFRVDPGLDGKGRVRRSEIMQTNGQRKPCLLEQFLEDPQHEVPGRRDSTVLGGEQPGALHVESLGGGGWQPVPDPLSLSQGAAVGKVLVPLPLAAEIGLGLNGPDPVPQRRETGLVEQDRSERLRGLWRTDRTVGQDLPPNVQLSTLKVKIARLQPAQLSPPEPRSKGEDDECPERMLLCTSKERSGLHSAQYGESLLRMLRARHRLQRVTQEHVLGHRRPKCARKHIVGLSQVGC